MGLAAILLTPFWLIQGIRHGKYLSNLKERLGLSFPALEKLPVERPAAIWLHAVSVGEVLASLPLARRLKEAFPDRPLIVSTTTITGQALAKERIAFADAVVYFPQKPVRLWRKSESLLQTQWFIFRKNRSGFGERANRFCRRSGLFSAGLGMVCQAGV